MTQRQKVVWYEGMNLEPHHFQQLDRDYFSLLNFRLGSIKRNDWGLLDLAVDKDALTNGQFNLLRCKGVISDGLPFNIPDEDPLPTSRNFQEHFETTQNELNVYLAIPMEWPGGRNCKLEEDEDSRNARFSYKNISLPDDNSGADVRQIGVKKTNFQVLFGNESLEDFNTLKIAEIIRSPSGSFSLSEKFIPTCLSISASDNLIQMNKSLFELLIAKNSFFSEQRPHSGKSGWTSADFTTFLYLHTLNTYIPLLNHNLTTSICHPEEIFSLYLTLVGQLTTFSYDVNIHAQNLPKYDHNNLSTCFQKIDAHIRILLGEGAPKQQYVSIPLEQQGESLYLGKIDDSSLLQDSKLFLAISGDISQQKIVDDVPTILRIASPDTINQVLSSFGRALSITHVPKPPAGLPQKEETQYFRLEPTGTHWEAICKSQSVAIFIPIEFKNLNFELFAI